MLLCCVQQYILMEELEFYMFIDFVKSILLKFDTNFSQNLYF